MVSVPSVRPIVKLMREKQAIEVIGAIDTDPQKVGRDLGEFLGAADAPWGVKVPGDAADVLGQAADVVIHSASSALPNVMEQLLACLEAESCVAFHVRELSPVSHLSGAGRKIGRRREKCGIALVGTGVNPGFVLDKLLVTLAAQSQRIDPVRGLRIVDASKGRQPLQMKIGAGMPLDEFPRKSRRRNRRARRPPRIGGHGGGQLEFAGR